MQPWHTHRPQPHPCTHTPASASRTPAQQPPHDPPVGLALLGLSGTPFAKGPWATYVLAHVVFGAHQVLHIRPELLVLPLKFFLGLQGFLQRPRQRKGFGLLLSGLCFGPVSLLCIASRDVLLFC